MIIAAWLYIILCVLFFAYLVQDYMHDEMAMFQMYMDNLRYAKEMNQKFVPVDPSENHYWPIVRMFIISFVPGVNLIVFLILLGDHFFEL